MQELHEQLEADRRRLEAAVSDQFPAGVVVALVVRLLTAWRINHRGLSATSLSDSPEGVFMQFSHTCPASRGALFV